MKAKPNHLLLLLSSYKRILLFLSLLWLGCYAASAQVKTNTSNLLSKNNILINMVGDASMLNVKYERTIKHYNIGLMCAGAGVGFGTDGNFGSIPISESYEETRFFGTFPHHLSMNFGTGKHFLETGFGGSVILGSPNRVYQAYPILGYRFQNRGANRSVFRFFLQMPIGGNPGPDVLFIPLGFSIGKVF